MTTREYYWKNKEKIQAHNRIRRKETSAQQREYRTRIRREVMAHLCEGIPHCQWPGGCEYAVVNVDHLSIDHVAGGGRQHRINFKIANMYDWLKQNNYPEGFRVLCFNHNCGKQRFHRMLKETRCLR